MEERHLHIWPDAYRKGQQIYKLLSYLYLLALSLRARPSCMPSHLVHPLPNLQIPMSTDRAILAMWKRLTYSRGEELLFKLCRPGGGAVIVCEDAVWKDPKELHWQPQRPGPLPVKDKVIVTSHTLTITYDHSCQAL